MSFLKSKKRRITQKKSFFFKFSEDAEFISDDIDGFKQKLKELNTDKKYKNQETLTIIGPECDDEIINVICEYIKNNGNLKEINISLELTDKYLKKIAEILNLGKNSQLSSINLSHNEFSLKTLLATFNNDLFIKLPNLKNLNFINSFIDTEQTIKIDNKKTKSELFKNLNILNSQCMSLKIFQKIIGEISRIPLNLSENKEKKKTLDKQFLKFFYYQDQEENKRKNAINIAVYDKQNLNFCYISAKEIYICSFDNEGNPSNIKKANLIKKDNKLFVGSGNIIFDPTILLDITHNYHICTEELKVIHFSFIAQSEYTSLLNCSQNNKYIELEEFNNTKKIIPIKTLLTITSISFAVSCILSIILLTFLPISITIIGTAVTTLFPFINFVSEVFIGFSTVVTTATVATTAISTAASFVEKYSKNLSNSELSLV